MTLRYLTLVLACFAACGCAPSVSNVQEPEASIETFEIAFRITPFDPQGAPQYRMSILPDDAEALSDQSIAQFLEYEYQPPPLSRIAIVQLGQDSWSTWLGTLFLTSGPLGSWLLERFMDSPRVDDASYLPAIFIPEHKTVSSLREAAARYRADLLLVYQHFCSISTRSGLFRARHSEGICTVEAVLLDVRTGLVPMVSVASESFDSNDTPLVWKFRGTGFMAQVSATIVALNRMSEDVLQFLGGTD